MAIRYIRRTILCTAILLSVVALAQEGRRAQSVPPNLLPYDLLLRGGHLLDDKNKIDAVRDVGIKDGKVAAVAEHLDAKNALKTIDVEGLYITPGLIDIHTTSTRAQESAVHMQATCLSIPMASLCATASRPLSMREGAVGAPSTISKRGSSTSRALAFWRS